MEKKTVIIKHNNYVLSEEERDILGKAYYILQELYYDYPCLDKLHLHTPEEAPYVDNDLVLEDKDMALIVEALDYFSNPKTEIQSE